jgi:hypothetical protein
MRIETKFVNTKLDLFASLLLQAFACIVTLPLQQNMYVARPLD